MMYRPHRAISRILLALALVGATGSVMASPPMEHPYTYSVASEASDGSSCENANVHCFALPESDTIQITIDDTLATQPVAARITLTGGDNWMSGIMCGEVTLPTEGSLHLRLRILPAATWSCDWCPDGEPTTSGACPRMLPVSGAPTSGLITIATV